MKNHARLLTFVAGVLCMLVVVSACGRKDHAEENPYARLSKADMKFQNIQIVNFTITPRGVQETDHPQDVLAQAQSTCAAALNDTRLYENVKNVQSAERASSTLIVQGELTKLRIVGGGARFWLGGMAGKSEMAIYVKLIDASTGSVITERDIRDDSNPTAGAYSMGATDRALPVSVGNLIADLVINASRK
jgi:hypothetical protein